MINLSLGISYLGGFLGSREDMVVWVTTKVEAWSEGV